MPDLGHYKKYLFYRVIRLCKFPSVLPFPDIIFLGTSRILQDAVTMAIVKQHGGDYGKQRFLFILGLATVPLLAGFAVDWYATTLGKDACLSI